MGTPSWGLLGPENLGSHRRTRTLGLGNVVRSFNDLAVPGLGGVWFGRQLFLATLGVAVAQQVRREGKQIRNIEVANAIEALACWLAYTGNGKKTDRRLRGLTKLRDKEKGDLSFASVSRPSFYVTQPMRRATVQALPAFGLVEADGPRFNSFRLGQFEDDADEKSSMGVKFIDAVCGLHIVDDLTKWIREGLKTVTSPKMRDALSPLGKMPPSARGLLRGRLETVPRREKARRWVELVHSHPDRRITLDEKPDELDDDHWRDLCAGTRFFGSRAAAFDLLNKIEKYIASTSDKPMQAKHTKPIKPEIAALRERSLSFLDSRYSTKPEATRFCEECSDPSDETVLRKVVERDGRVLLLDGDEIELHPNFRGQQLSTDNAERNTEDEGAEEDEEEAVRLLPFPEHMSPRVNNLYYLSLDLRGQLAKALK